MITSIRFTLLTTTTVFSAAIDLKDLIVARNYQNLDDIIVKSYPFVKAHEKITDCIEQLKDYAEDSIPVLDDEKHILGVITAMILFRLWTRNSVRITQNSVV